MGGSAGQGPPPWAVPSFLAEPTDPRRRQWAAAVLETYFAHRRPDGCPSYSGAMFDRLAGGGDRDQTADGFAADDLVAVTMLSVRVDAHASLKLLDIEADDLSSLLVKVRKDVDIIDATADDIGPGSPADQLWRKIDGYYGLGPTKTSKLLARKRPRLLPVYDSVVCDVLDIRGPQDYWREFRDYLNAERGRWEFVRDARATANLDKEISVLRCLDVLLWMSRQPGCPDRAWTS